jgi:hypothetical protein
MAARSFVQLLGAADPGVVVLGISFVPNGTGAIASSAITGRGVASVAWSTNKYVVTLQDVYPTLLSATVTLQLDDPTNAATDQYAIIGAVNLNSKTIEIIVRDISTPGPTNLSNANKVHLCLVLKNSQV